MFPHGVPSGSNSPLSGFVEGFLNGVFVDPAKIWPEPLKVNGLRGDTLQPRPTLHCNRDLP